MQQVIERAWYGTGEMCQRLINPGEYASEMLISRQAGETSYRWTGEDRDGQPLHVTWITDPDGLPTLLAYELPLGGERS